MKVPPSVLRQYLVALLNDATAVHLLAVHNEDAALIDAVDEITLAILKAKSLTKQ